MANKRITDLPAPNTLIGTEALVADQRNADFISGFNTVQIPISDLSEFILIGQSNLSITEDAQIGGNLTVTNLNAGIIGVNSLIVSAENGITAEGAVTINSDITITGNIIVAGLVDGRDIAADGAAIDQLELDVEYLSGAIDDLDPTNVAADIVYLSGSIDDTNADVDFLSGSIDQTDANVVFLNGLIGENSADVIFLSGAIDTLSGSTTTSPITSNVIVGGIDERDVILAGTSIQELTERLLLRTYYPTFVLPSVNLVDDILGTVEVGTTGLTLTANYNAGAINGEINNFVWDPNLKQNDRAGTATQYTFTGATIPGAPVTQTGNILALPSTTIGTGTNTFTVAADYNAGPQPLDSLGNNFDSPLGAGSVSKSMFVYGRRNAFYGVDLTSNNSAGVRALTPRLNPSNGTTFTINIPIGATDVAFAYPDGLGDVTSVVYVEGAQTDIKGVFTLQTVNVEGANGFAGIDYNLYTYSPASPYAETSTYIVTI